MMYVYFSENDIREVVDWNEDGIPRVLTLSRIRIVPAREVSNAYRCITKVEYKMKMKSERKRELAEEIPTYTEKHTANMRRTYEQDMRASIKPRPDLEPDEPYDFA